MRIDVLTLFPNLIEAYTCESIIGRAQKNGFCSIFTHQIRDYAFNKHKRVDDTVYGGGKGMLMQAEPIALCFEDIHTKIGSRPHFIYMSPKGKVLNQKIATRLASDYQNIAILCGRYEGVDQRLIDSYVDEQISIGDFVLTGGELPALILIDAVLRNIKGVLPDESCFIDESHTENLLEYPQYTKPENWRGYKVPEVLLSGHHAKIEAWRQEQKLEQTKLMRPELLKPE